MDHVESDAVVLRHVKQGETSHVVTLFARAGGKVAVLAKGSRKPGSRFGAGLDLFSLSHIRYRPRANRDLVFLDVCELRTSFERVTHDVFGYAAASVCVELVDRLVPEGASSEEIYDLLVEALDALAQTSPLPAGQETRAVALPIVFQLRLMDVLGIAPELTECSSCGTNDLHEALSLSARRGGLLCSRCRSAEGGRRLARETVHFLRASLFGEFSGVMTAPDAPTRGTVLEARSVLDAVLEYHHHGNPATFRGRKFLDQLLRSG
jgi:DNA repair protein RecO (recombination protein O)